MEIVCENDELFWTVGGVVFWINVDALGMTFETKGFL